MGFSRSYDLRLDLDPLERIAESEGSVLDQIRYTYSYYVLLLSPFDSTISTLTYER